MKSILTDKDYQDAARILGVEVAAIKAVAQVESAGAGFLPDGQPKILFERHYFHRLTGGKYDKVGPDISGPYKTGSYGPGGQHQHDRLEKAAALDRDAALQSASYGKFQIMGSNFKLAGFATLQLFINAMYSGEPAHLMAFCNFIRNTGLLPALKAKNWAAFARGYNGTGYAKNRYDEKMAAAYRKYSQ
ncbi:N-acetylmuramidase family protein [Niabella aurantiaca]|uniref:N-acetylmuramidase family protein n=1 Tax=Niabella aurantiaca TaxID=379900 RepID=UPI0003736825|nr:N-acetylmuramidase family protein [Niabella aurantiaca]